VASRQREWQKKQKALGNCTTCGKPRDSNNKQLCEGCLKKLNAMRRKRYKMKVVEGGGR
jgi:NMD protein affecting ribosome stability and mRNA decay